MNSEPTPSDEHLVARFVAGDAAAFDLLVERYRTRVYAICYRYFGDAADAEDAAQETFVLLLRRAQTFSGHARFSTWMYRVATNACNDLARKRSRRPPTVARTFERHEAADPSAEDQLLARELGAELAEALRRLDADQRSAIIAHDLAGVPYAEIAARAGVAVGTVKSRIHRGHARLAELLTTHEAPEPADGSRPPTTHA